MKATSRPTRSHYIGSLSQLDPQGTEDVFLFSVGVKMDPTAPRKLPAFMADIEGLLTDSRGQPDEAAHKIFDDCSRAYGYNPTREKLYLAGSGFFGFHLSPKLFRERDLDRVRLRSFKDDKLPAMVSEVMYQLNVQANELTPNEERETLVRLLQSPASTK